MKDPVTFAVAQCPFLAKVAAQNGNDYARSIAINPTEVAAAPEGPDSLKQYEASFQMFHGPSGIVPLVHSTSNTKPVSGGACPFHAQRAAAAAASEAALSSVTSSKPLPRTLPLATISLSFGAGSNFGDFLRKQLHNSSHSNKRPPQQHRQPPSSNSSHLANSGGAGPGHNPTNTNPQGPSAGNPSSSSINKPQRPLTDPTGSISSSSGAGFSSSSTSKGLRGSGSGPSGTGSGLNLNPSSPGMQNPTVTAAASGTTAAVNPSTSASPNSFNPSLSTGGAGCSSSSTAAGLRGIHSSSSGINGPGAGLSPSKSSFGSSSSSGSGGGFMGKNNTRSGLSGSSRGPAKGIGGAARGPKPPGSTTSKIASSSSSSAALPSTCPLRKWLGPFAGLVFNEYDKIICPPPIVAARAALAKTAAVQQLRPQQLPVKLVAVAAVAAAANLPAGAVREHFEKFSLGWFIAVHATIPFVAMLRKAVIMPKYSILVTIASAVIGQMVGSRLERARLQHQAAVATQIAVSAAAASSSSGSGSMSKVVRDSSWREKMIAGGVAGFGDLDQDSNPTAAAAAAAAAVGAAAAAAAAACGAGVRGHSGGVVGLGSLFAKLPVVKA